MTLHLVGRLYIYIQFSMGTVTFQRGNLGLFKLNVSSDTPFFIIIILNWSFNHCNDLEKSIKPKLVGNVRNYFYYFIFGSTDFLKL